MRVKICGIKKIENALCAVYNGVDAIGFVFYEKSPRFISSEEAKQIIKQLPAFVNKVGVFVNQTLEEIIKIIDTTGIDTVQLHGSEQNYNIDFVEKLASKINLPIIYSIRIKSISDEIFYDKFFKEIQGLVGNILFDRLDNTELGGTGKVIFFDKERPLDKNFMEFISKKVIIAGGINKGNVKEIINFYKPYGIDVSSGVEKEKGVKDNNLIQEFLSLLKK